MTVCEGSEFGKFSQEKMGGKWQVITRLHFDSFQNMILRQFAFHCSFRLFRLKHEARGLRMKQFDTFLSFLFNQDFTCHAFGAKVSRHEKES